MLQQINNSLSRKKIVIYEIMGEVDDNGELIEKFTEDQVFDPNYDYLVSLVSFEGASMFPNIIIGKNNVFVYKTTATGAEKTIELSAGAYNISDINDSIQARLGNDNITIEVEKGSGKSIIKLKNDHHVFFNKENDIRKLLGYTDDIIINYSSTQLSHISPKMCDVVNTIKIFIHLDIIKGSWFKGSPSNVLYSFSNSIEFGAPLSIKPRNKYELPLFNKSFDYIKITFKNEKEEPINFIKSPVALTIEIKQV